MKDLISAVRTAIENNNLYAPLFLAIALPDICSNIEYSENKLDYAKWFDKYLDEKYRNLLSGKDCYNLRYKILHEASDNQN